MKVFICFFTLLGLLSSCEIPKALNPFDNTEDIVYPDTTVIINSLAPQICEVKIEDTDSTYVVTSYWTDKLTGRIIYKMGDDPYRKSRMHGTQFKYDEEGDTLFKEILLADNHTPETELLRQLFWEEMMAALEELPTAQRDVFIWNELEDQTFQQISDRTGVNIKTLISRKGYAVKHLRKRLAVLYEEFLEN